MVRGKHIHKYRRAKLGKSVIYKCAISGCTHYILKDLIEGRISVCWRCPNPFVITKKTLKNCPAMPHCDNCYPKSDEDIAMDNLIEDLIK